MAIEVEQLATLITQALDAQSDTQVDPAAAREQNGQSIAQAIAQFVQGRTTTVTGNSVSGGPVTGVGIIN